MAQESQRKVRAVKAVKLVKAEEPDVVAELTEPSDLEDEAGQATGALSAGVVVSYEELEEQHYQRVRHWVNPAERKKQTRNRWLFGILLAILVLLIIILLLTL